MMMTQPSDTPETVDSKSVLTRSDTFPTPVWKINVPRFEALNASLLEAIKAEQSTDRKGKKVSNKLGWHSQDNLHHKQEVQKLLGQLQAGFKAIVQELEWDLTQVAPRVISCWAMINPQHAHNAFHHHPNSVLSGVYYVQTPENCGDLYFHDPRSGSQILLPPTRKLTRWTIGKIRFKPQAGACFIFPSWFWHGVESNLSEEERISISFNIAVGKHPTRST